MKKFLPLFLLLLNAPHSFSQKIISAGREFNFEVYTVEEGLLQSNISSIFQDSKGYLWVTNNSGVSRFDGVGFKNYTVKEGLSKGPCQSVQEDNNGNIWIGTATCLNVIQGSKVLRFDTAEGISHRKFWSFFKDRDGSLWAGNSKGIVHLDPGNLKNPLLQSYEPKWFKDYRCARCIFRTKKGELLVGTDSGIFILEKDSLVRYGPGVSAHCITEADGGILYVSGWGSTVYRIKDGTIVSTFDLGTYVIYSLKDKKGNIWFATFGNGIFRYDGQTIFHYGTKEGLPTNSIWCLHEDREGNIWLGSWGAGLYKYSGERFSYLSETSGLVNDFVNGIAGDSKNNIWFSTEQGVSKYDPSAADMDKSITNYTRCENKEVSKIMHMLVDRDDVVWLPAYGFNGYKLKDGKISYCPGFGGFHVFQDSKGNIWRGTDGSGAIKENGKEKVSFTVKKAEVNRILFIYEDRKGNILLGNDARGLNVCAKDTVINIAKGRGFTNASANTVCEDKEGSLWIGTQDEGVYKCRLNDDLTITILDSFSTANGLSSNGISSMLFDGQNDLVIGTLNGVCVLDGNEYKKGVKSIRAFGKADGYAGGECQPGIFLDKSGKVWIGSTKGAYCYDPASDKKNTVEPNTHLTAIDLFFEKPDWVPFSEGQDNQGLPVHLVLPYNMNHLTFHFIGISLTAPERVLYRYMIKGLDKDWSPPSSKGEVTYSNLPPGSYTFLVKARNYDGVWNSSPTAYTFIIEPPWWKRNWFIAISILIFAAAAYLFVRIREKNLVLEKKVLEEKVNLRTAELKKAYVQIGEKNKDITDSINYAQRIQQTIFPPEELLEELFTQYFVLYKPKDIVSGDFYGVDKIEDKIYFTVADCTGHGVPGAFVSLVAHNNLNKCVGELGLREPNEILDKLSLLLEESFSRNKNSLNDGMDISLCYWDKKLNQLKFSGANNPIWVIRDGKLTEIKGDKQPVGKHWVRKPFTAHTLELKKGDQIYLFSDGYADQFGGPKGKKFKYKQLQELLLTNADLSMENQKSNLERGLELWKGQLEQVDDVVVLGIKITEI